MDIVNVAAELGAGASPREVEMMVRAVRVATDLGRDAQLRSARRTALEQMKFPTDAELEAAVERLPGRGEGLSGRAQEHLDVRRHMDEVLPNRPYGRWRREYRYLRETASPGLASRLSSLGYERAYSSTGLSPLDSILGLDVIDPEFYRALVASEVERLAPSEIFVRALQYRNPFGEELAAVGTGAEALTKAAGAIETVATLPDRRAIKKVDRRVAEATEQDRIDQERERTRRAQLENDLLELDVLSKRVQFIQAMGLPPEQQKQLIIQLFIGAGYLELAEAAEAIEPSDAAALIALGSRQPALERRHEPDPGTDEEAGS